LSFYLTLLGAPGCGKGTQSERLAKRFNIPVVGIGNIIRSEIKQATPLGIKVKNIVADGDLVPDELIVELFEASMHQNLVNDGVILDGYPRTLLQSKSFYSFFLKKRLPINIIYVKTSFNLIKDRLLGRMLCPKCGAIFHSKSKPPLKPGQCDQCHSSLIVRPDDNETAIRHRYDVFLKEIDPILSFFSKSVVVIDGDSNSDDVFSRLLDVLVLVKT
tara:strand:+ start:50 stop:700 length:651 start_codon:yes stop_codon:yes gene_type:complete